MITQISQALQGEGISPGLGVGTAWIYEGSLPGEPRNSAIHESEVQQEQARIDRAIEQVCGDLIRTSDSVQGESRDAADIFRAHQSILQSPTLSRELRDAVRRELICAEEAVQRVFLRWEQKFENQQNNMSQHLADDIADLSRRLHRVLGGIQAHPLEALPEGTVLVAPCLLPSDTVYLSRRSVMGIVVARANRGAHAALLATGRGIPAVGQLPDLLSRVSDGDTVLVDGLSGDVVLRPDEASQNRFVQRVERERVSVTKLRDRRHEPTCTRDGTEIQVAANVGNREESRLAAENGADGTRGARIGVDGAFGLGYRSDRELRDWMAKDPIERFRRFLVSEEVISTERAEEIVAEVRQAVDDAAKFADEQPVPDGPDGLLNVFAEGAVPLHTT